MNRKRTLLMIMAAAGAAAVSAVSVANIDAYAPVPHGLDHQSSRLEEFCERHWGTMSADLATCRFEQTHYFGLTSVGAGARAQSGISVLEGDRILFEASEGAVPVVGVSEYQGARDGFLAASDGYLAFRASHGAKLVALRKVKQLRCFRQDGNELRPTPCES